MIKSFPQWQAHWDMLQVANDFAMAAHMGLLLHAPVFMGAESASCGPRSDRPCDPAAARGTLRTAQIKPTDLSGFLSQRPVFQHCTFCGNLHNFGRDAMTEAIRHPLPMDGRDPSNLRGDPITGDRYWSQRIRAEGMGPYVDPHLARRRAHRRIAGSGRLSSSTTS